MILFELLSYTFYNSIYDYTFPISHCCLFICTTRKLFTLCLSSLLSYPFLLIVLSLGSFARVENRITLSPCIFSIFIFVPPLDVDEAGMELWEVREYIDLLSACLVLVCRDMCVWRHLGFRHPQQRRNSLLKFNVNSPAMIHKRMSSDPCCKGERIT